MTTDKLRHAWGLAIGLTMLAAPSASAATFKLLYAFTGGADGGHPWATPLLTGGDLYVPAFYGGGTATGQSGTVLEYYLAPPEGFPFYTFAGAPNDGAAPMGGMVTDGYGDFFGTTTEGGFSLKGTLYEISGGYEFVLNNFAGSNGADPEGALLMDPLGNIYGTTSEGGVNGSGTMFAYTAGGTFVNVHNFGSLPSDGVAPASGLALYEAVAYGTTTEGGRHGWGVIYSVNLHTRAETVLYVFRGLTGGGTPVGGLLSDGKGNLYGTTSVGGSGTGTAGDGVVFEFNIASATYTVLHTFTGPDGSDPVATLIQDAEGNLYGTTYAGGAHGYGTVFELTPAGTFTTLYSFTNGTDGSYPYAGLTIDSSGNLYGAATSGGQYGWGTLFEITP